MVEMTDELRALWQQRVASIADDWWTGQYEAALTRVEYCPGDDSQAPYWGGRDDARALPGGHWVFFDECRAATIVAARERAFELLVLADLAEASLSRGEAA